MTPAPEADPAVEQLLLEGRPQLDAPFDRRQLATEVALALLFVAVAAAMLFGLEAERDLDVAVAVGLVLLLGLATHVELDLGAGYASPLQIAFVPMLLLLPTPAVPALVAAAWLIARVPSYLARRSHPQRAIAAIANAWFSVGPALVLVAADAQTPDWGDWPWYLAALAAQFAFDFGISFLREWIGRGVAPEMQLGLIGWAQLIDLLLSPLGLLAAFASDDNRFAFLLLVPPASLLLLFARERERRIGHALELSEASRLLLETERAAARNREAIIAGASHEILTPLAVLGGLVDRGMNPHLPPERRQQVHAAMRHEMAQLRHLVRQFLDYTRLKAGRSLPMEPRPVTLHESVELIVESYGMRANLKPDLPPDLPPVRADPDRIHQMLMILVSNAVKFSSPADPVEISARPADGVVEVTVADHGRGIDDDEVPGIFDELSRGRETDSLEGAGIGLFVLRTLADAQGAEVRVESEPGSGSRFTLRLPRADQ